MAVNTCFDETSVKKRTENWTEAEIFELIDLWRTNLNDLRQTKRNRGIYENIARHFSDRLPDIRTKIKNLTAKYREEVTKIGSSGGSPSRWIYFDVINAVISRQPAQDKNALPVTFEIESSGATNVICDTDDAENRRKRRRRCCSLEKEIKSLVAEMKRSNRVAEEFESKSLRIAEKNIELQEELIKIEKEILNVVIRKRNFKCND